MNFLDWLMLIPLLWGAYKGYTKGFIVSFAGLVALIGGLYGAAKFSDYTYSLLQSKAEIDESYLPFISFSVTFLALVVGIHFLAKFIHKIVEAAQMGILNRLSGALFGIFKNILVLACLVWLVEYADNRANFISNKTKEGSFGYPILAKHTPRFFAAIADTVWWRALEEKAKETERAEEE